MNTRVLARCGMIVVIVFCSIKYSRAMAALGTMEQNRITLPIFQSGTGNSCDNESLNFDFSFSAQEFDIRNAFWMMWMSYRAYASEKSATKDEFSSLGFDKFVSINRTESSLQAFITANDRVVIVAFRGSNDWQDWLYDITFAQRPAGPQGSWGKIHRGVGFELDSGWAEILDTVRRFTTNGQSIWVTGHSLGGALGELAVMRLREMGFNIAGLYTFGAPRMGDETFARHLQEAMPHNHFRIANFFDAIPHLPPAKESAEVFSSLLPASFQELVENFVVRPLRYAHGGEFYWIDRQQQIRNFKGLDGDLDVQFWQHVSHVAKSHGSSAIVQRIIASQRRNHGQDQYLCQLRRVLNATSK